MLDSSPFVSVIMPVYNADSTLNFSVTSVLQQSYSNFELIIVDDGSNSKTKAALQQLDHPQIKLLTQENSGPACARNAGIAISKGIYIACIDADDVWRPTKLELQLEAFQRNPLAGVCYCWTDFADQHLNFVHADRRVTRSGNVYRALLENNFIVSGSNTMILTEAIDEVGAFDGTIMGVEDWELHLRLSARYSVINVPKVLVDYRKNDESLTSDTRLLEQNFASALGKIFVQVPEEFQSSRILCKAAFYRYLATRIFQNRISISSMKDLCRYLYISISLDPKNILLTLRIFWPKGAVRYLYASKRK